MTLHTNITHTSLTGRDNAKSNGLRPGPFKKRHFSPMPLSGHELRRIVAEMLD